MPIPELAHLAASRISDRKTEGRLDTAEVFREDLVGYLKKSALDVGGGIMKGMRDVPLGTPESRRS